MSKPTIKNVPPPPGSKPASSYQRFIPREELGDFASWKPGTFGASAEAAAPPPPPEPTAEDWRERIAAARQAGYQEGYRDGLVALESFKQSFAQQATSQIGALLDAFDAQFNALDAAMAQALTTAAVQLARQVLRSELAQRPGLVAQVATDAVNAVLMSARHISVQVHPQDLPLVSEGAEEALRSRQARLIANPAIARGGVLVESDAGAVDARIESRWAQAVATLGSELPLDDGAAS
ncbi:MAG: flagellar assembly protein FliH [Burkholderiales bacterium]|nr:flagellar biosynthesis protein [Burkholderiales bacterium]MDE2158999.1 flagellar assembly protein FliH [Burkholderiales bacterium]MDE2501585.1 flagellar assembly protein FliH [Burkholderiales bacterium]